MASMMAQKAFKTLQITLKHRSVFNFFQFLARGAILGLEFNHLAK